MGNEVQQTVVEAWIRHGSNKTTPGGFISGNAVCCNHRGERADRRGRGGIKLDGEGFGYNCFNCGFKVRWQPGQPIIGNIKRLMTWLMIDEGVIQRLSLTALKYDNIYGESSSSTPEKPVYFDSVELPKESKLITKNDTKYVTYLKERGFDYFEYDFYKTNYVTWRNRLIIPFYWRGDIVGFTGRTLCDSKPKYLNKMSAGYVFNMDQQHSDRKIVLVTEGPIDALSIDGVSVLGNTINDSQVEFIEKLNKQIVVVPDSDQSGDGLIKSALKYEWGVSFPDWLENCKDANEASTKYGRLFTLKNILNNVETSPLRIKLLKKRYW